MRRQQPSLFRDSHVPDDLRDTLILYKYRPVVRPVFLFDQKKAAKVYERFMEQPFADWESTGNVVSPQGLFTYLKGPDVRQQMWDEFNLYRFHHRNPSGRARMGWLRNMFYSLTQQMLRRASLVLGVENGIR
jgi:hypothetical protein